MSKIIGVEPPKDNPVTGRQGAAEREELAKAVHRGRFPPDREPTPFEHEGPDAQAYCRRIADSVLEALSVPLPAGGGGGLGSAAEAASAGLNQYAATAEGAETSKGGDA